MLAARATLRVLRGHEGARFGRTGDTVTMAQRIKAGDKAPDFTLPSQSGEPVRLHDRLGERVVVLYFYPKDNTPGCTAEACAFRDSHEVFTDAGAEVIGISSDSVARHTAFADRHQLPFTLLSDQGGQVRKLYGVPPVLGLLPGRVTYVIDRAGVVRHVFSSMTNIDQHIGDALRVVQELQSGQPA
jgi:peroxiredoxin Q/BCP